MDTFGKRVKNVTLKDVNKAAGQYFRLDDAVTSVCGSLTNAKAEPSQSTAK